MNETLKSRLVAVAKVIVGTCLLLAVISWTALMASGAWRITTEGWCP